MKTFSQLRLQTIPHHARQLPLELVALPLLRSHDHVFQFYAPVHRETGSQFDGPKNHHAQSFYYQYCTVPCSLVCYVQYKSSKTRQFSVLHTSALLDPVNIIFITVRASPHSYRKDQNSTVNTAKNVTHSILKTSHQCLKFQFTDSPLVLCAVTASQWSLIGRLKRLPTSCIWWQNDVFKAEWHRPHLHHSTWP